MSEKKTKITRKPASATATATTKKASTSKAKPKPAPKPKPTSGKATATAAKPKAKPAPKKRGKKTQQEEQAEEEQAAEERGEEEERAAEQVAAAEEAEELPINEEEEAAAAVAEEEAAEAEEVAEEEKESYRQYLTRSWFVELYKRIAAQVVEQPTLYYNISTNEEVLLEDVVELTPEEVEAVPELSDSDDPEQCSDECQSIKHKLKAQGYGIYAAARLLSRPASTIAQLKATIAAEENIDRFDPAKHAVRTVPIKPSKSVLAATGAKRAVLDLDKTFDSYNDRVTQLLLAASEDDPACIDVLTGTVTCAGAKGIAEVKQTRTKLASFTYPETAGYDVAQLRKLVDRYLDAYEVALREQAAPASKAAAKPKTPASKRVATGAATVPPGKPAAKAAAGAGTLPQPSTSTAQRTIGGAAAPLRTHAPSKIPTPAVGTAPARTAVGSTSSLITTLQASKVTQRLQEQLSKAKATLKKGGKAATPSQPAAVSATKTVKSSLERAKLAPTVTASSTQKPVASKTATVVRLPTGTKQSRVAAEEPSASVPAKKRGKARAATPPEEEEEEAGEDSEEEEEEAEEEEEEEEQAEDEAEQEEEDEEAEAEAEAEQ